MLIDFSRETFDVIIQAGQSNAEGCGLGLFSAPFVNHWPPEECRERIWQMEFNCFQSQDGSRKMDGGYYISPAREMAVGNQVVGNFALSFAHRYLEKCLDPGRKILILRSAVGGTGFQNCWQADGGGYLFENMMNMTKTALELNAGNRAVALLWHQGENEASGGAASDYYYRHISAFTGAVRKKFGAELPFIAGDFVEAWRKEPVAGRSENCAAIAGALRRLCGEIPGARFVETDGLASNHEAIGNNDHIHFSREALYALGNRYFDAFIALKK
ncbi:MAG: sialate O-acetylesterase [Treponema sp.]|jgi:hypothetical protein|nr:sialate O-acetylesterase [Treponema sp.]